MRPRLAILALAALPLAALPEPLTKDQGDAILDELRRMRQALERIATPQPAPQPTAMPERNEPVTFDLGASMSIGRDDAPVTVVAFVDYECPFCRRFDIETLPEIRKRYVDTGKVRYVVRDLPLEFHPRARKAAEATYCAGDQGAFWPMREKLAANFQRLEPESLSGYARELGLNEDAFKGCLESGKFAAAVAQGVAQAGELGISGTPTFVIGKASGGKVKGTRMVGAQPWASFDAKIREALGE